MRPGRPAARGWRRQPATLIASLLLSCLSGACAFNPPLDVAGLSPGRQRLQLASVPFYPEEDFQCGPAALAGLLGASGVATDTASLTSQVYLPGRHGSLQLELQAATRRAGRIPYPVAGTPAELLAQLQVGRPVLVLQNLRTRSFPAWHYAVLVGFDTDANQLLLNSGLERGLAMAAPAFLRTWDWAGRWALVALRPGELPANPALEPYIEAVTAFETLAGGEAAAPAWRTALRTWPHDPRPYLALGNRAYAAGDLPVSLDYYRRGLRQRPGDPALGNNLASVLGELGCPLAAMALLETIRTGLAPDSNWLPVIAGTREEQAALAPSDSALCAALYPG